MKGFYFSFRFLDLAEVGHNFSVKHSRTHTYTFPRIKQRRGVRATNALLILTLLFRVARGERRKEKASVYPPKDEKTVKKSSGRREIEPRTAHHKHTERGEERLSKSTNKRRTDDEDESAVSLASKEETRRTDSWSFSFRGERFGFWRSSAQPK